MPPGPVHSGPSPVSGAAIVWAWAFRIAAGEAISSSAAPAPTRATHEVASCNRSRTSRLFLHGDPRLCYNGLANFPFTNISPLQIHLPCSRDHKNRIRIGEGG